MTGVSYPRRYNVAVTSRPPYNADSQWTGAPGPPGPKGDPGAQGPSGAPSWMLKGSQRWFRASNRPIAIYQGNVNTTNLVAFLPMEIDEAVTVDQWGTYIVTQGVGGTQTMALALYDMDANNAPRNRILNMHAQAAVMDLTVGPGNAKYQTAAISPAITIPPGRYWLGVRENNTGMTTPCQMTFGVVYDPRCTGLLQPDGSFTVGTNYASAIYSTNGGPFMDSPPIAVKCYWGRIIWLRQA